MNQTKFHDGLAYLSENGLNLAAVLACDRLPADVAALLADEGIDLSAYGRMVLLGNGGRRFWEAFSAAKMTGDDPVDRFSVNVTTCFIEVYLPPAAWRLLYPGPLPLPLQRLGELAGWCHPSPLGSGVSGEYGLWFAYRAAFVTAVELPVLITPAGESPCRSCMTHDCVVACPSRAVQRDAALDLDACVNHRLLPASSCAERCLARLACPYAAEHRYTDAQLSYHYRHSLNSLGRYMAHRQGQNDP